MCALAAGVLAWAVAQGVAAVTPRGARRGGSGTLDAMAGSDPTRRAASTQARHARFAVSAVFFLNAVLYANVVPRLPEVKLGLDLSNAAFGAAIAAMPVGALTVGLFAAVLIRKLGSARVASLGLVVLASAVALIPHAQVWLVLAAALFVAGALDAIVDVAQNAHGFRVQRLYGRSIINAFHGLWSVGAVTGGILGSIAAGLDVPFAWHVGVAAVFFSLCAIALLRWLLPGPEDAERDLPAEQSSVSGSPASDAAGAGVAEATSGAATAAAGDGPADDAGRGARFRRIATRQVVFLLVTLGLLSVFGVVPEDVGASWSALYLRTELGAGAAVGGLGFVALMTGLTIGRLTGDRAVDRFGQRGVATAGGFFIAAGMGIALGFATVPTAIAGFALTGFGAATTVPAAMHAADEIPGLPHGVGLTIVSWLLRVGFLVFPPLTGLIADATSLRVALLVAVVAGLGVVLTSRVLEGRKTPGRAPEPATT